jgi:putative hydrolase of the HAD superfamily
MVKAVLFDFYDTLVYVEDAPYEKTRHEMASLLDVTTRELASRMRSYRDERMLGVIGTAEDQMRRLLTDMGRPVDECMVQELATLERKGLIGSAHPYDSTFPTLRTLRQKDYKLGLVSNASRTGEEVMDSLGFRPYFDCFVVSYVVGLLKPDPAIFLRACTDLNVEPTDCVFVADGGFSELDAAHSLGMATVKVTQPLQSPDYGSSEYFDWEIHDLGELTGLLEERIRG